ncbi:MAG: hypothetical protein IME99_03965 [Proteobacteria bacterium]|nr:hypothetical protein [Pseudomonadota bacterium]
MIVKKIYTLYSIVLLAAVVLLSLQNAAHAAPTIGSVSGTIADGSLITVGGANFGANGPNILLFDDFESGTHGSTINTGAGSATVGQWDRIQADFGGNQPIYDNAYSVSGSMANRGDQTVQTTGPGDSTSAAVVDNINTTDVFISYWYYLPTTSSFPCTSGSYNCNWKAAWVYGATAADDDQVLPVGLPSSGTEPFTSWAISCNDCYGPSVSWFNFSMYKGAWYRISAWVHATDDNSSERDLWVMSTDKSMSVTQKVNWSGRIFKLPGDMFEHFSLNAWARECSGCAESAPRFDDVYLATGSSARARVIVGNASTYSSCTNLSIATVTSWSNTVVTATVRQGSFSSLTNAYLYVIDANGVVNTTGYPLCPSCITPASSVSVN